MTSECQPNQVHSAIVNWSIPVRIIPDVVSSSPSQAVAYSMPSTLWDTRRKELATFKEANGHTNVPSRFPSNKPLGQWVNYQRHQYKLLQENDKSCQMTKERIKSLNELDFEWRYRNVEWDRRLQELATFKEANRHTNVPEVFPSNKPLGIWVRTQRNQYRLFNMPNEKSAMTTERIKSLNELDFEWVCVKDTFWEGRLQELATFKQDNGHTNVPKRYPLNKPLGHWVGNQRTQYRLFNQIEKSAMTEEHIQSLEKLDFEWWLVASSKIIRSVASASSKHNWKCEICSFPISRTSRTCKTQNKTACEKRRKQQLEIVTVPA
jgi:hypothetical protein